MASGKRGVPEYVVDGTIAKTGSGLLWLWVAIGPKYMRIPALATPKESNMFAAERLISGLAGVHRKHLVSMDGGTWYPQACRS
jgi:hypothetical protein